MYSDKNDIDKDGLFLKTEEEIPEGMSTAKREYLQYIKDTMQEQWGMTMSKKVFLDETNEEKYLWQKKHTENLTGTSKSYKPNKISKSNDQKKYETWKI